MILLWEYKTGRDLLETIIGWENATLFRYNAHIVLFVGFHLLVYAPLELAAIASEQEFGVTILAACDNAHCPALAGFYRTVEIDLIGAVCVPCREPFSLLQRPLLWLFHWATARGKTVGNAGHHFSLEILFALPFIRKGVVARARASLHVYFASSYAVKENIARSGHTRQCCSDESWVE